MYITIHYENCYLLCAVNDEYSTEYLMFQFLKSNMLFLVLNSAFKKVKKIENIYVITRD